MRVIEARYGRLHKLSMAVVSSDGFEVRALYRGVGWSLSRPRAATPGVLALLR